VFLDLLHDAARVECIFCDETHWGSWVDTLEMLKFRILKKDPDFGECWWTW
jgi:hypothetical protein